MKNFQEFTEIAVNSPKNSTMMIDSFANTDFEGFSFVKSSSYVDESVMLKNAEKMKESEKIKYERKISLELEAGIFCDEKGLEEIIMEEYF